MAAFLDAVEHDDTVRCLILTGSGDTSAVRATVPPPRTAATAEARAGESYEYTDRYFQTRELPEPPKAA